MAERVRITDVSPRDGLQNEPGVIPTAEKVRLIRMLVESGVDEVEATSFVSPKWVPQLADADDVARALMSDWWNPAVRFLALIPNEAGARRLEEVTASADNDTVSWDVAVFTAASETFSKRNTNATIAETIERFRILGQSRTIRRAYVSCVISCPYEGPVLPERVVDVVLKLAELPVGEIDLGDTIGAATPESTRTLLRAVVSAWTKESRDVRRLVLHLHDTFGRAAECVKVALDMGVRSFDGAVAGLGGCPYASTPGKRAPGNISTELLVRTVHDAGYETGVDLKKLAEAAAFAREIVARARAEAGA